LTEPSGSASDAVDAWQRYRLGWHVLAGAVVALTLGIGFVEVSGTGRRVLLAVVLAAVFGWYSLVGAATLKRGKRWRAIVYLVGLVVILNAIYPITMSTAFLLFMINPQIFAMLDDWTARLLVILLVYGQVAGWTIYHLGPTPDGLVMVGLWVFVPMVFALLMGAYISGIIAQSRRRRALIEELTRTRSQLAAERHEAGVHTERERLATEIHDTLAQGFTSILMVSQTARALLDRSSTGREHAAVDAQLDLIERTARENLAEARALVAALTPPDLQEHGLAEALVRLAERHTRDTGVPVTVAVAEPPTSRTGAPAVGGTAGHLGAARQIDVVMLRAVQEALTNIRRHAAASSVRIELGRDAGQATLAVTDDGQGFDPASIREGFGLSGLRSRASTFGGQCMVDSQPGHGTTVRMRLPEALA
jgi:signal transduction histidine kinase